jgi:hypothetical protein
MRGFLPHNSIKEKIIKPHLCIDGRCNTSRITNENHDHPAAACLATATHPIAHLPSRLALLLPVAGAGPAASSRLARQLGKRTLGRLQLPDLARLKRYKVRFTLEADDLLRLYDFLLEKNIGVAERALAAITEAANVLRFSPFSCRKALADNPFLRELIIPFGSAGYVALFDQGAMRQVTCQRPCRFPVASTSPA